MVKIRRSSAAGDTYIALTASGCSSRVNGVLFGPAARNTSLKYVVCAAMTTRWTLCSQPPHTIVKSEYSSVARASRNAVLMASFDMVAADLVRRGAKLFETGRTWVVFKLLCTHYGDRREIPRWLIYQPGKSLISEGPEGAAAEIMLAFQRQVQSTTNGSLICRHCLRTHPAQTFFGIAANDIQHGRSASLSPTGGSHQ